MSTRAVIRHHWPRRTGTIKLLRHVAEVTSKVTPTNKRKRRRNQARKRQPFQGWHNGCRENCQPTSDLSILFGIEDFPEFRVTARWVLLLNEHDFLGFAFQLVFGHNAGRDLCDLSANATGLRYWASWLRTRQKEDTLWRQHCVRRCGPSVAKRGNVVARRADTTNVSEGFHKHFSCPGQKKTCPPQMLRAWRNESTFRAHDHFSDVAATMRPRFAGSYGLRLTNVKTSYDNFPWIRHFVQQLLTQNLVTARQGSYFRGVDRDWADSTALTFALSTVFASLPIHAKQSVGVTRTKQSPEFSAVLLGSIRRVWMLRRPAERNETTLCSTVKRFGTPGNHTLRYKSFWISQPYP